MNATNYYVWSEGEETGPMDHAEVIRRWVAGELPKGFLWRRSDQSDYRPPGELYEERTRDHTDPSRIEPAAPDPVRAPRRARLGTQLFCAVAWALGILALLAAVGGGNSNGHTVNFGLMTDRIVWAIIGLACIVTGIGTSIHGAIQDLVDKD